MKPYLGRIILCAVPVLLSVAVAAWAYQKYEKGEGGFRLGVDLSGGTVLVYEVDPTKMTEEARRNFKPEELADRLKRRIDPADLFNVTVRPIGGEPARVEVVLPYGGGPQRRAAEAAWKALVEKVKDQYQPFPDVKAGDTAALVDRVVAVSPNFTYYKAYIADFVADQVKDIGDVKDQEGWDKLVARVADKYIYNDVTQDKASDLIDRLVNAKAHAKHAVDAADVRASVESFKKQADIKDPVAAWKDLRQRLKETYLLFDDLEPGDKDGLVKRVGEANADAKDADVSKFIDDFEANLKKDSEGKKDAEAKKDAADLKNADVWARLREAVGDEFIYDAAKESAKEPAKEPPDLAERVARTHADKTAAAFVETLRQAGGAQRRLTSEEVDKIKVLIGQQGQLEFRIVANNNDDAEAIAAAVATIKDPKNARKLADAARDGVPPPSPSREGATYFPVTLGNETFQYTYSWVEIGKQELYSMHLNADEGTAKAQDDRRNTIRALASHKDLTKAEKEELGRAQNTQYLWDQADQTRDREAFRNGDSELIFCRTIPNRNDPTRLAPKDREQGKKVEWFMLTRDTPPDKKVTGDHLTNEQEERDSKNQLAVGFRVNSEGSARLSDLTGKNVQRQMAIILDGQVQSAPVLQSQLSGGGQITGNFTSQQITDLVRILKAGALPATLRPEPVSEKTMGATLGDDTIFKGTMSVGLAFLAVMIFMAIYYRFAGLVACVALLANLLLTVAFMVLVGATFTLPGLAGLVLMLGMAVDANVLIYERLREERERGASLALAVRNGYDRAFPTIIDTHLTSIFTAIVLYAVGNDQLRGFGISLTVGLIISLFTSLFVTRTIFNVWLSQNWLKGLNFLHVFQRVPHINFMRIRYYWFTATVILTVLGAGLFIYRLDKGGLNIDFTGGTAYTGQLVEAEDIGTLRQQLEADVPDPDQPGRQLQKLPDLAIEQNFVGYNADNKSPLFTVRTAEKDAAEVQRNINARLGDKLERIDIQVEYPKDAGEKGRPFAILRFVNPKTGAVDYASKGQVERLLTQQFTAVYTDQLGKKAGEPYVRDKLKLYRSLVEAGEQKEGRFSEMRLEWEGGAPLPRDEMTETAQAKFRQDFKDDLKTVLAATQDAFSKRPQPQALENFDSKLAASIRQQALWAIAASWAAILLYLWFRFGSWTFGAATVLCLIHDLFFTLGVIAACHYIYVYLPGLAYVLGLTDFKIDLQTIAALLTLVGYSVSDTIVVFDRIREVRGKNPLLTAQTINDSVNQTLSRTILSSVTVWLVVVVLYIFGGEGVHLFAFVMIIGVIVGTYSSIYIASPLLLIFGEGAPKTAEEAKLAAQTTAPAPA